MYLKQVQGALGESARLADTLYLLVSGSYYYILDSKSYMSSLVILALKK